MGWSSESPRSRSGGTGEPIYSGFMRAEIGEAKVKGFGHLGSFSLAGLPAVESLSVCLALGLS